VFPNGLQILASAGTLGRKRLFATAEELTTFCRVDPMPEQSRSGLSIPVCLGRTDGLGVFSVDQPQT
jgi:hypothetical protein